MRICGRAVHDLQHSRSGDKASPRASSATRPLLSHCKSRTALRARINYYLIAITSPAYLLSFASLRRYM